ncbi:helix-turn-helix domain-containing protein [Isachenkonia alkalipeptolytica]|uniref:Helix-turn-helix domain-containing protein n=1 Tax=Isachenkonia alkalipeptolytica TaxID=2565777 RepID=A0AA44BFX4_9CLOT|nr:helix-turn-helix domain-containing protein [Isachenkonia alkalipeptolytica]NBG89310.1 helix-turn-helix domain-containing protein [Isachenkonia alkalipeptolytica]
MNRLAEQIKKAREQASLSEKALAKKCGISESYLRDIESGRKVIKEDIAEKILKKLGKSMDFISVAEEPTDEASDKVKAGKKQDSKEELQNYDLKPTGSWQKALGNLVKTYPVQRMDNGKVVGEKSLPLMENKVEGYHPDKLFFIEVTDNALQGLRIKKGDIVTVLDTQEIENGALYLINVAKGRMVRKLRKEGSGKIALFQGLEGENGVSKKKSELKIIGKCIKVEFSL